MATFRIEAHLDRTSSLFYAEIYFTHSAAEPIVRISPEYPSHEAAIAEALPAYRNQFPHRPLKLRRERA